MLFKNPHLSSQMTTFQEITFYKRPSFLKKKKMFTLYLACSITGILWQLFDKFNCSNTMMGDLVFENILFCAIFLSAEVVNTLGVQFCLYDTRENSVEYARPRHTFRWTSEHILARDDFRMQFGPHWKELFKKLQRVSIDSQDIA